MALPGGKTTRDHPFLFPSLSSPSKIEKVCKAKENFKDRCTPFFDNALDQLEAQQNDNFNTHLQQKIDELIALYEETMYSYVTEDLNMILSSFQDNDNNNDKEFDIFLLRFYEKKEKDFLQSLQAALTSLL